MNHIPHWLRVIRNSLRAKRYGIADFNKEDEQYQHWVAATSFTPADINAKKTEIAGFPWQPKISIVLPVYNIKRCWLERAIGSVLEQIYENWELCITDDASPNEEVRHVLRKFQSQDTRIKVSYLETNLGMSGSSNEALSLAEGEYVALLDHDDELSQDSLFEVVKLLNQHPDAGIIYSDEDKLTMSGKRLRPVIKSDWDPQLFLTYNYLCHLVVCRRDLMVQIGGFRRGFEGSQDYDLLLRVTELTDKIYHIPKVLYHWRMIPGSAAAVVNAKSQSFERAKQALRETLARRHLFGTVTDGEKMGTFKIIPVPSISESSSESSS